MYKVEDVQFELLGRVIELEELGFKPCIFVDSDGEHHEVYSLGSPSDGYSVMTILSLEESDFQELKARGIN